MCHPRVVWPAACSPAARPVEGVSQARGVVALHAQLDVVAEDDLLVWAAVAGVQGDAVARQAGVQGQVLFLVGAGHARVAKGLNAELTAQN